MIKLSIKIIKIMKLNFISKVKIQSIIIKVLLQTHIKIFLSKMTQNISKV